ncbi:hypothetical protein [Tateyamaria sp.]|uniref:hypothetical protein n=1 Tax=Tateyamaria sp. TaxID=1929288 RepID=UPI00329C84EA
MRLTLTIWENCKIISPYGRIINAVGIQFSTNGEQKGEIMTVPTPPIRDQFNDQKPGLAFNWEDWLPYFEEADITDAQKREMIETLWQIVIAFVDLGFELNPHQQAHGDHDQQSCGQNLDLKALLEEAVLKSEATELTRRLPNNPRPKEPTL